LDLELCSLHRMSGSDTMKRPTCQEMTRSKCCRCWSVNMLRQTAAIALARVRLRALRRTCIEKIRSLDEG
jgi:hypothetical protein